MGTSPPTQQPTSPPTRQPTSPPTQQPSTCVQFCSLQNVTQAGCSAHSSDQQACLKGYITRGSIAIPCARQSCGCFADGHKIQDCPDLGVLCASMMQGNALRESAPTSIHFHPVLRRA